MERNENNSGIIGMFPACIRKRIVLRYEHVCVRVYVNELEEHVNAEWLLPSVNLSDLYSYF